MKTYLASLFAVVIALTCGQSAVAVPISVELTANALGLGTADLNDGGTVDPDQVGFITSPTTGQGSILKIEQDGTAGNGTVPNPLMLTVTAKTRLDNFPSTNDYQAGILYITRKEGGSPDPKDEGLGVRCFTVLGAQGNPANNGLRQIDGGTGRAKIEGSKEVSGGVDEKHPNIPNDPNGPDHVDEIVNFDFNNAGMLPSADSVIVTLTKFKPGEDYLNLHLDYGVSSTLDLLGLNTASTGLFTNLGGDVWNLDFGAINAFLGSSAIAASDVLKKFSITSVERPNDEKSHFLIHGMSFDYVTVAAEPSSCVLALASLPLVRLTRRRRN
jgi:hypothetical protein